MLFNCLKDSEYGWRGTRVSIFLMAVFDALLGTREGLSDPRPLGVITGDLNICESEKGKFNVWNQTFADTGKAAFFHSFFPRVHQIAQPDFTRRDVTTDGIIGTFSRMDRAFINLL